VARAELGTKRHCGSCGAKFYDLGKTPILCPKCGSVFEVAVVNVSSRREAPKAPVVVPEKVVEELPAPDVDIVSLDEVAANEAADVDDEDIVVDDDTEIEDDDDDTFLEADEDDEDDVTGLLGGGLAGEDEEV
jgi:uncharacterized protein (TIGR02300 family)